MEASFAKARQAASRSKLLVEQDLRFFHESHYKAFDGDKTCAENAAEGFEHFAGTSGLAAELTEAELGSFKARFVEEMEAFCKHDGIDSLADPNQAETYMEDFLKTLEDEKPLLTEKLEALLKQNTDAVFEFYDWLANFSTVDLKHKTGLEEGHANQTMLLQTQSIVGSMVRRSLPASFDGRTHWPECSEIIGRIHNQGPE